MSDTTRHHTRWQCPVCDRMFSDRPTFIAHVALHALAAAVDPSTHRGECWECTGCLKVFHTRTGFKKHARTCTHTEGPTDD